MLKLSEWTSSQFYCYPHQSMIQRPEQGSDPMYLSLSKLHFSRQGQSEQQEQFVQYTNTVPPVWMGLQPVPLGRRALPAVAAEPLPKGDCCIPQDTAGYIASQADTQMQACCSWFDFGIRFLWAPNFGSCFSNTEQAILLKWNIA